MISKEVIDIPKSPNEVNMSDKYQAVIDEIYRTKGKNDVFIDCAYMLACAIKECMTHKDDPYGFIGKGYLYEKIGKALNRVGMNSCVYQYASKEDKLALIKTLKAEVKASAY
tara:strand:+ start:289 stop:624 length:336 start_codon:yes stop_codon:yes gene_type:complete